MDFLAAEDSVPEIRSRGRRLSFSLLYKMNPAFCSVRPYISHSYSILQNLVLDWNSHRKKYKLKSSDLSFLLNKSSTLLTLYICMYIHFFLNNHTKVFPNPFYMHQ